MKHPSVCRHQSSRRGLTLIELVGVLLVLLLLLSLVLPSMRVSRGAAHRLECQSHLKELALASANFAGTQNGRLPLLSEPAPGMASGGKTIWVVQLMPYLDQAGAIEYIEQQKSPKDASEALKTVLSNKFKVLCCPKDPNRLGKPGALNYGANIGYGAWHGTPKGVVVAYDFGVSDHSAAAIDWNNNGKSDPADKEVARATGVFWHADPDKFRSRIDDMVNGDGSGQTILFSESLDLPPMHLAGSAKNGINPRALDAGVGLGYEALGLVKNKQPSLFLDRAAKAKPEYIQYFAPNSKRSTTLGNTPAARSMHQGIVNVAWGDGHVSTVSNDIDWAVWASLHSPNGIRHGQAEIMESKY